MKENEITIPVYLVTGFLDSGKTSFFRETFEDEYFDIPGLTLLITCEEGEEEYGDDLLKSKNTVLVNVEEEEDFTYKYLKELDRKYRPERVMIEYNCLWGVQKLEEMKMPKGWGIVQHMVMVDASSFLVYMANLKALFVEMVRNADMVDFNRCSADMDLVSFRRSVKVVNRRCQIFFENENGMMPDMMNGGPGFVPYDLSADIIEIGDDDFGIFYVDAGENREAYEGRTVHFLGQVLKSSKNDSDFFVPARKAMTCCVEDIAYIGYLCRYEKSDSLNVGDWVRVTARIEYENEPMYGEEGPVLYLQSIEPAEKPEEEIVYFT